MIKVKLTKTEKLNLYYNAEQDMFSTSFAIYSGKYFSFPEYEAYRKLKQSFYIDYTGKLEITKEAPDFLSVIQQKRKEKAHSHLSLTNEAEIVPPQGKEEEIILRKMKAPNFDVWVNHTKFGKIIQKLYVEAYNFWAGSPNEPIYMENTNGELVFLVMPVQKEE